MKMAAKDLDSDGIKKQEVDDITTCCICTEVYTDPKALPCIHTFCMKCIQETGLKTNKGPGDEMPCPICRQLFKIPADGFPGLPKHFFIERLIQAAKVSDQNAVTKALCSVCLEETKEQEGIEIPTADTYCVVCKHKLCEECCIEHRKFKATKNHKLIPITEYRCDQIVMTDLDPSVCEHHPRNILNVYCADCKTVVCAICFIDDHKNHEGSHVDKFVEGFRKQIESNADAINECKSKAETRKATLLKVKEDIQERVEKLECDVANRRDEIKQLTNKHEASLLQSLCLMRQSKLKEIQMVTDDVDAYLSCLETYNSYCQKLMTNGSASDICDAFVNLSVRAMELVHRCQPMIEEEIQSINIRFTKSELEEFLEENCDNLIGEIEEESDPKTKKRSEQKLLAEQSNENDLLRKENEIQRTEKDDLRSANEQLKNSINKEVQANDALTEELRREKTNNDAHIKELKQKLDDNKITHNTLQVNNDKLKQELDKEKIANYALQVNNDKLVQEVNTYKATIRTLEENVEKPKLEATQIDKDRSEYKSDPVFVQTIRTKAAEEEKKGICGMTILDKELFVVNEKSSDVEVYDSMELSFSRRWNLKKLIRPRDIGSCNRNKCLYIFDCKGSRNSNEILRVDSNGKLIKNWPARVEPGYGLSVTVESNVILTDYYRHKLMEYSSDGQLICEINLSSDAGIRYSCHAIKLTNGDFVVSHADGALHRVCMLGTDGKLKKSFGGKAGSTIGQMSAPFYLSFDGNGFVMVADSNNRRVLILDSDLQFHREILSKGGKPGLRRPERILLDESNGRLFVADNEVNNERILIFNVRQ